MTKHILLPTLLIAICLLSINCSKNVEPAPPPPNYNGTWTGTTSQGKAFSFVVSGDKVTSINISYTLTGNCSSVPSGSQITLLSGNSITGNSFSIAGSTSFSGSFSSGNAAMGSFTVNFTSGNPPGCSSTANGTWTATK